jgi:hypothetical protein
VGGQFDHPSALRLLHLGVLHNHYLEAFVPESQSGGGPVEYPTNHVVAVLDTPDQTSCALDALVGGGFLESEIELRRGTEEADRLDAGTGRRGFQDWWIRLFQSVGLRNTEIEMKDHYEQALRNGHTVLAVMAPTDERKDLAAQMIRECGGRFINFFGHLNVERIIE